VTNRHEAAIVQLTTIDTFRDVSAPVEKENFALEEAEVFLNTWKLRGFHGG
jgi:hypothetical protein